MNSSGTKAPVNITTTPCRDPLHGSRLSQYDVFIIFYKPVCPFFQSSSAFIVLVICVWHNSTYRLWCNSSESQYERLSFYKEYLFKKQIPVDVCEKLWIVDLFLKAPCRLKELELIILSSLFTAHDNTTKHFIVELI